MLTLVDYLSHLLHQEVGRGLTGIVMSDTLLAQNSLPGPSWLAWESSPQYLILAETPICAPADLGEHRIKYHRAFLVGRSTVGLRERLRFGALSKVAGSIDHRKHGQPGQVSGLGLAFPSLAISSMT